MLIKSTGRGAFQTSFRNNRIFVKSLSYRFKTISVPYNGNGLADHYGALKVALQEWGKLSPAIAQYDAEKASLYAVVNAGWLWTF